MSKVTDIRVAHIVIFCFALLKRMPQARMTVYGQCKISQWFYLCTEFI